MFANSGDPPSLRSALVGSRDDPVLEHARMQLLGASPGEQTLELVHPVRELDSPDEALAEFSGVNVHVGPAIDDRKRLRSCGRGAKCSFTWTVVVAA